MANNSSRIVTGLGVPNTQSLTGTGTPLGFVSASVGAIYTNLTDGSLWTKTSGTNTTTGWVAGASAPTVVSITASAPATAWNQIILVDATSGSVTVILPTAVLNDGKSIEVKKIDSSTNSVIVDANAAETIDGALTQTISLQYNNARFVSDGTNVVMESISNGVVSEYGENTSITDGGTFSTTLTDIPGSSFIIPSAGTWKIDFNIFAAQGGVNQFTIRLYDNSNILVPNSQSSTVTGIASTTYLSRNTAIITTTGATIYKLKGITDIGTATVRNNDNISNGGRSKITWEKISGYLPVTGQTADYVNIVATAIQSTGIALNSPILFNTPITQGNISFSSGTFTLSAGKTYILRGSPSGSVGQRGVSVQWFNVTSGVYIGGVGGVISPGAANGNAVVSGHAEAIITPTSTITVQLRMVDFMGAPAVTSIGGASDNPTAYPWATIEQLGTSAVTTQDVLAEFGVNTTITDATTYSTVIADIAGSSFTLPSAGSWEVKYNVYQNNSAGAANGSQIGIYDSSNVLIPNSLGVSFEQGAGGSGTQFISNTAIITTSAATTYKLRGISSTGTVTIRNNTNVTTTGGQSTIAWRKVSGYIPTSGQSVDYVQAKLSANINKTAVGDIVFNSLVSGNIPLNTTTGVFTLTAGKTYQLEAHIYDVNTTGGSNDFFFEWVDAVSNTSLIAGLSGTGGILTSGANTRNYNTNNTIVYTPSTNQTVKVRITNFSITSTDLSAASNAIITQIGSSAYTTLNTFVGATSVVNGSVGGVPQPLAGEQSLFLRGNGTWSKRIFSGARRYASAATSIPNSGAATLVTTGTVDFSGSLDVSTGTANTITITTTGYYTITGSVGIATGSTTGNYHARILVNGTSIAQGGNVASVTDSQTMQVTTTANLTAGDLVTLGASQTSGGAQNTVAGSTRTYLEVTFVGL